MGCDAVYIGSSQEISLHSNKEDIRTINPYELEGYNSVAQKFERFMQLIKTREHSAKESEYLKELTGDFVKLMESNGESLAQYLLGSNVMQNIIYAQIRLFHHENMDYVYPAADFFFRSLLPDEVLEKEIQEIKDWRIQYVSDLNFDNLNNLSQEARDYLIQKLPLIPWMHIEMSEPMKWHVRKGIDNYLMMVEDDCGAGPHMAYLSKYTDNMLRVVADIRSQVTPTTFYPYVENMPKGFFQQKRLEVNMPSQFDNVLNHITTFLRTI